MLLEWGLRTTALTPGSMFVDFALMIEQAGGIYPGSAGVTVKMVKYLRLMTVCTALAAAGAPADRVIAEGETSSMHPSIAEQHTFFYYKDLAPVRAFYGGVLGLEATFEDDWVSIYRITPTSFVGATREGGGAQHRAQEHNAVMLSITTEDVDAWYRRLKAAGNVHFIKELYNHQDAPIRAFLVADPGGYTVEFFQWLKD